MTRRPAGIRPAQSENDLLYFIVRSSESFFPAVKRWSLGRLILGTSRVVHAFPDPLAMRFGKRLGDLLYRASPRYRRVALRNLSLVFGSEWTEEQLQRTMRETFHNIGKSAVEFLRMASMSEAELRAKTFYDGREHLDAALERGKGVLYLTAHFGNWELMGARLAQDGYMLNVVARDADDADVNRMTNAIRERWGYRVFSRDKSAKPLIQALRRNEMLAILNDQNYTTGIFVPFFGRLAATASGIASLARATDAAIVPAFCIRQPDNTHRITIQPALPLELTGNKDEDLYRVTAQATRAIEEMVRRHPEQWLWIHDRWKHRPPDEAASRAETERAR